MDNLGRNGNDDVLTFLHIPKTGGKTLESCIFDQCSNKNICSDKGKGFYAGIFYYPYGFWSKNYSIVKEEQKEILQREDLLAVVGHFRFGVHDYMLRTAKYLTLMRSPMDRIVSLYNHVKISNPERFHSSFIEVLMNHNIVEFNNDQTRRIAGFDIDSSIDSEEEMFRTAETNIEKKFALVGTTERFDEFLVLLGMKCGWDTIPNYLPRHVNASSSKVADSNSELVEAINLCNKYDSKLYEFADVLLDRNIAEIGAEYHVRLAEYTASQRKFLEGYPKSQWPNRLA